MAQLPPEERAALRDRVKQKIQTYLTVELSSHEAIEFDRNLAGVKALLARYSR